MKKSPFLPFLLLLIALMLPACATTAPSTPTPTSTPLFSAADCAEDGTLISGLRVPHPTQGLELTFQVYLPPCYSSQTYRSYTSLYLLTLTDETSLSATDNQPMSLANRLIRSGEMPPVIVIVPTPIVAYGSDAAYTLDLVPYVDSLFRTLRDPRQRGVGGISHGAAISVRMAFQFPEVFGSVGVFSGGIVAEEKDKFTGWITRTPPGQWPRALIDVGDQDGIRSLTDNLLAVLDQNQVPYTLNIGQGGHSWDFWSPRMESYLLWFAQAWK